MSAESPTGGEREPRLEGLDAPELASTPGRAAPASGEPELPGPFAVGRYASELRTFLRGRPKVRLLGEVTGVSVRAKAVYFELRDAEGAMRCSMWRDAFDRMGLVEGSFKDGAEVVVAGGLDYYPGSATASPSFSFRATHLRLAGEGDLLAQLAELRRRLASDGLFEPQKKLPLPALPRTIGVVTGRDSAAKADILAALARRGWRGRVIFAHPPVQDRHAAPQIRRALSDLAGIEEVEAIIVSRGGGSLADLWAFCDENLCRAVALLRVPVVSAVGHEVDTTLLDDVAAVACSTPTHAVDAAIRVNVDVEAAGLVRAAAGLERLGRRSVAARGRELGASVRTLSRHAGAQRRRLHQLLREIRAASARSLGARRAPVGRFALVLGRRAEATRVRATERRRDTGRDARKLARHRGEATRGRTATLDRLAATLAAHDPERVLERGYALVSGAGEDELISSAADARRAGRLRVRFADDDVGAEVIEDE